MRRILACAIVALLCPAWPAVAREVRTGRHIYGAQAPAAQVLDVYLLAADKPAPVLVQIVSGGWRSDPPRGKSPSVLDAYHDMGYSIVTVCHRSIDQNVAWPAPADDVARAIQYIRLHAREWNIDPDRLALTGRSSGGHVAMMVAFGPDRADPASDDAVRRQSSRVRCVIEQGGPTDLAVHMRKLIAGEQANTQRRDFLRGRLQYLLAVPPEQVDTEESYRRLYEISPIRLVDQNTVPVLMLYAGPEGITSLDDPRLEWDTHTPISGLMLAEKLKPLGVPYELVISPELARDSPRSLAAHRAFFEKYNGPRYDRAGERGASAP